MPKQLPDSSQTRERSVSRHLSAAFELLVASVGARFQAA
jgi:hypothetical protein